MHYWCLSLSVQALQILCLPVSTKEYFFCSEQNTSLKLNNNFELVLNGLLTVNGECKWEIQAITKRDFCQKPIMTSIRPTASRKRKHVITSSVTYQVANISMLLQGVLITKLQTYKHVITRSVTNQVANIRCYYKGC